MNTRSRKVAPIPLADILEDVQPESLDSPKWRRGDPIRPGIGTIGAENFSDGGCITWGG